jgi:hypothetical protein
MGIISSRREEIIMVINIKRFSIGILVIIFFIASCIAGFYTIKYYNKVNKVGNNTNLNAKNIPKKENMQIPVNATVSTNDGVIISEKTKIIKKYNYNMGVPTTKEVVEVSGPDILGMDRKAAEDYFNKQQFYISDFNSKNVTLFKDINTWPPNYYVVKAENNAVNIYQVDDKGKLLFLKKSVYDTISLPSSDLEELQRGKSFEKLEDIENMFDELNS